MKRAFRLLIALPVLYLVAALIGATVPGPVRDLPSERDRSVLLLRGPIHVDLALPLTPELRTRLAWLDLDLDHPGAGHLLIGWGAEDFYTTTGTYRDVSVRAVWRGITGDQSVIRAALAGERASDWPAMELHLSRVQYNALLERIEATFAGRDPLPTPGFSSFDVFYRAHGRFHLFRTCNVWIGETLRAAGLRFGFWTPTPFAVRLSAHIWQ